MRGKKIISSILTLALIFTFLPNVKAYAADADKGNVLADTSISEEEKRDTEEKTQDMVEDISNGSQKNKERYTPNIEDYKLVTPNSRVGYLLDSYKTLQELSFFEITEVSTQQVEMKFQVYSAYSYTKDSYYSFEFFRESGSRLNYFTTVEFTSIGYNRMNFKITSHKSVFEDQPYIYIRVGTRRNSSSMYYSDTLRFKVVNPFYKAKVTSFNTSVPSDVEAGTKIKLSATSDVNEAYYEFYVKENNETTWTKLKGMGPASYTYWTPSKAGVYKLRVRLKNPQSPNKYDSYKDLTFVVNEKTTAKITSFETSVPSGATVDTKIKLTALADLNNSLYEFYVKDNATNTWTKLKGMGPRNYAYWTPSKAGTYTLRVRAKGPNSTKKYDSYKDLTFVVNQKTTTKLTSFETSVPSGATINTQIKLTALADLNNSLYEFYVKDNATNTWKKLKGMGPRNYAYWTPSKAGTYTLRVRAKGPNSTKKYDSYKDLTFRVL